MEKYTQDEKILLRELAKKQLAYSQLPIMEQRKKLWTLHNELKGVRPMIVMEELSFEGDLLPPLVCSSPFAREIELSIRRHLMNHELVDDDKVIPDSFTLPMAISFKQFDHDDKRIQPKDSKDNLAFQVEHYIEDLESDFERLKPSIYSYDKIFNQSRLDTANELIGDILPIKLKNRSLEWHLIPTLKAVNLMGLETLMCEMALNPSLIHRLMQFITDDLNRYMDWMEEQSLLTMNNQNDYVGSGSMGFTTELSSDTDKVLTSQLWGNVNSQESSEISPEMYGEMVFPYCKQLTDRFGLVYYGCCEPVHGIWRDYLSKLENLRKVSISAWCNEDFMGEALAGSKTIYSRKPSPNFIGVGKKLDESAFEKSIIKTLNATKGCKLEFIFRDVYTLSGELDKPAKAVQIIRRLIENQSY